MPADRNLMLELIDFQLCAYNPGAWRIILSNCYCAATISDGPAVHNALSQPAHDRSAADALLLSSLDVRSSLYHLGQYCGAWNASTSGRARASFHLILHGDCRVDLATESLALAAGDGIFFLRDLPHTLMPAGAPPATPSRGMQPLEPRQPDGTGLACGFFEFRSGLDGLLADALPDYLLLRASDARYAAARGVFQLILDETTDPAASPLVLERLTDLLIFFMLRHLAARDPQAHGLLVLARDPAMAGLLQAILAEPALPWSLQDMADRLHMSKATFHRRFTLHSGTTPAQLLQALRMRAARRLLEQGAGIQEAAERVGYQSQAAFSRAFQRAEGMAPSACRKRQAGAV